MKYIVLPVCILLLSTSAFAQDMRGTYCVVSESEWTQCIELRQDGVCRIVTEFWDPTEGSGPRKNMTREVSTCRYEVKGDLVSLISEGRVNVMKSAVYDCAAIAEQGWSPGLKLVNPTDERDGLDPRVYWKEPRSKLRRNAPPR
ncbi:hypothetical protein M7784_09580 [Desulfovibrio aminophilus]|nr:hypothetical protein [Desulfovibrio aminophilus]MCM0755496.1 hypothetical protein [Desulfovibrio aminophilus]